MTGWTRTGEYLYRGDEQIAHFSDWRIAALAAQAFELDAERRETDAEINRLREALEAVDSEIVLEGQLKELVDAALGNQQAAQPEKLP